MPGSRTGFERRSGPSRSVARAATVDWIALAPVLRFRFGHQKLPGPKNALHSRPYLTASHDLFRKESRWNAKEYFTQRIIRLTPS